MKEREHLCQKGAVHNTFPLFLINLLDGVGTAAYTYTSGGFLAMEGNPLAGVTEKHQQMSKRLRFWSAAARRRFVPGAARRTASRLLDQRISPGATCRARPKRRRAAALQTGGRRLKGGIYYVYDGKRVIQERDTNNTPTVSYTRGNDLSGSLEGAGGIGGLLERADGYNPTNGSWANHNYYHADGNGNVTYLESDSQTLAASYRYDAYGNTLASSGTLAVSNTYRFSSKEFIPAAGLYYYLYRFYDPALQRWVNRDPLAEKGFQVYVLQKSRFSIAFPNSYRFVRNSAINKVDPLGLHDNPVMGPNGPQNPDPNFNQQMLCAAAAAQVAATSDQILANMSSASYDVNLAAQLETQLIGQIAMMDAFCGKPPSSPSSPCGPPPTPPTVPGPTRSPQAPPFFVPILGIEIGEGAVETGELILIIAM